MTCPRCDRADCDAVTGRAGPPEVIVVERRCDGEPVDWRARALEAEAAKERLRAALATARETALAGAATADAAWGGATTEEADRQRKLEAEVRRLREALERILTPTNGGSSVCIWVWTEVHAEDCNARGVVGPERCITCTARKALEEAGDDA